LLGGETIGAERHGKIRVFGSMSFRRYFHNAGETQGEQELGSEG